MTFFRVWMTLLLLPMLLFTVACSVDTVEESNANRLVDPPSTDFHFQTCRSRVLAAASFRLTKFRSLRLKRRAKIMKCVSWVSTLAGWQ